MSPVNVYVLNLATLQIKRYLSSYLINTIYLKQLLWSSKTIENQTKNTLLNEFDPLEFTSAAAVHRKPLYSTVGYRCRIQERFYYLQ